MTTILEKRCYKCEQFKQVSLFHKEASIKDGYANYCKTCTLVRTRAYYQKNKALCNSKNLAWKKNHPIHVRARRWRKVGINLTVEAYQKLFDKQEGQCLICKIVPPILVVDHSHITGRIRGLLCSTCNRGLGLLGDCSERLSTALEYLKASE